MAADRSTHALPLAPEARSHASTENAAWLAVLAALPSEQIAALAVRGFGRTAILLLQNACESRCFFCASAGTTRMPANEVTTVARVDAWVADAQRLMLDRICVGGTEPALHPAFERALESLAGHAPVELMTSGLRLATPGTARHWFELGVRSVAVPIYSTRASAHDAVVDTSGALERVSAGLDAARDAGIEVYVHTLALKRTLSELDALAATTRTRWSTRLAIGVSRPKAGTWSWSDEAATWSELELAASSLDVSLVGFPHCVLRGKPRGAARVIEAYFRTTRTAFASECGACSDRPDCVGVMDEDLARGMKLDPITR